MKILSDTVSHLKGAEIASVSVCETTLGVSAEAAKHLTGTIVVCTTIACFEVRHQLSLIL